MDLFFHGIESLGRLPEDAAAALRGIGMSVDLLQPAPAFCRLRAELAGEVVLVDLVAERVPNVFPVEKGLVDALTIGTTSSDQIDANLAMIAAIRGGG